MEIKKIDTTKIELNNDFKKALRLMEKTREHLFITGKAGTGKSTLLQYFRNNTKKNVVVLAPTGVAAVNVKGQTIHSFFGFDIGSTPNKVKKVSEIKSVMYWHLKTIIIDEVSMVRADLLDCIDAHLRKNGRRKKLPFGGVQMIFVGDLYQLPPVVTSDEPEIFNSYYK